MSDCTPEFWTLKDIQTSLEKEYNGKKKIVIPMFQRGKRWDKNKKETFIDSLRKKYPIGTLLFYKTNEGDQEIYTLIDGLQRGTAIKEYLANPSKFFTIKDFSNETMAKIYNLIVCSGNVEAQKNQINQKIEEYVKSLKSFDEFEIFELYESMVNEYPILHDKLSEFGRVFKEDVKKLKDDYNSLCNMRIPAIVYTGDESTLPEIFERINSKGVALTEYEIYAASWPRKEFNIKSAEIIEYVLKKYDTLNDSEYSIKDYDRDSKRIKKNVNAFEYVFGLSKYIQNKYSSLNFYKKLKDDETNPVAFQLLNACFNSAHNQIKDVHKIITRYMDNIDTLENALYSSIEFVNSCIEPILKFKGNNRKVDGKIFHSQYQIMSLISFTFRKKYDIHSDTLKVLETWKEAKAKLKENIWKYYVYDIITKYWSDGGTGKIHTANNENRYFVDLTQEQFATAFDSYTQNLFNIREKKKVADPSDIDYVILNTIYVKSFSAMDQLSINTFDVEHIATKDQMKKLSKLTGDQGLPISHLANLCYLPEYENRAKGSNNFYQDDNYLKKSKNSLEDIESKYSFTKSDDLEFMDLPYSEEDYDVLLEYFIRFLKDRNDILKVKFLQSLGYNGDLIAQDKQEKIEVVEYSNFNEQYFRITKIGKLVVQTINYLAKKNLLSQEDIDNLKSKEFSSKLGCWKPILVENQNETIGTNGVNRYYSEKVIINNKEYYLSKEWFEKYRNKYVSWIKNKLNIN